MSFKINKETIITILKKKNKQDKHWKTKNLFWLIYAVIVGRRKKRDYKKKPYIPDKNNTFTLRYKRKKVTSSIRNAW